MDYAGKDASEAFNTNHGHQRWPLGPAAIWKSIQTYVPCIMIGKLEDASTDAAPAAGGGGGKGDVLAKSASTNSTKLSREQLQDAPNSKSDSQVTPKPTNIEVAMPTEESATPNVKELNTDVDGPLEPEL